MKLYSPRLPYINNARAVIITLVINLAVVFIFTASGVNFTDVLWDSLFCAVITVVIDVWFVYSRLRKMREAIPGQVPESRFMQKLPLHPLALGAIYAFTFALLTVGVNGFVLWFFNIHTMALIPWLVYKLTYATVLSIVVVEYCIFRYIQPDWTGRTQTQAKSVNNLIHNPLPKVHIFKQIAGSIATNIVLNFVIGSLLGGVVLGADGSVIIFPVTAQSIPITGLIFGLIIGFLLTGGVIKAMNELIIASRASLINSATADWRFSWLPKNRAVLTVLVCVAVMVFSAIFLRAVLLVFDIPFLNFYQFTVFITIYAALLGKPLSGLLTRRCLQPDYICYQLKKAGMV